MVEAFANLFISNGIGSQREINVAYQSKNEYFQSAPIGGGAFPERLLVEVSSCSV
jgi:hypothetical protein